MKAKSTPKVEDEFYTDAELAARFKISRGSLQNDRWKGKGIPYHKINRKVRYSRADVEKYFADRKVTPEN
jgi:hypothetical protein